MGLLVIVLCGGYIMKNNIDFQLIVGVIYFIITIVSIQLHYGVL